MPKDCDNRTLTGDTRSGTTLLPITGRWPSVRQKRAVRHGPKVGFDVPYTQLASDLRTNSLPAFSFITPNLIDDMHDGTIQHGRSPG